MITRGVSAVPKITDAFSSNVDVVKTIKMACCFQFDLNQKFILKGINRILNDFLPDFMYPSIKRMFCYLWLRANFHHSLQ